MRTSSSSSSPHSLEVLQKKLLKTTKLLERARKLKLMGSEYSILLKKQSEYEHLIRITKQQHPHPQQDQDQNQDQEDDERDHDRNKNNNDDDTAAAAAAAAQEEIAEVVVEKQEEKDDDDGGATGEKNRYQVEETPKKKNVIIEEANEGKQQEEKVVVVAVVDHHKNDDANRMMLKKKLKKVKNMLKQSVAGSKSYKKLLKKKKEYELALGIYNDVKKIPKLSAILAMDTDESQQYKQKIEQNMKAKWYNSSNNNSTNVNNNNGDDNNDGSDDGNKDGDNSRWTIVPNTFDGTASSETLEEERRVVQSIENGIDIFNDNPEKYLAVYYPTTKDNDGGGGGGVELMYVLRAGTTRFQPNNLGRSASSSISNSSNINGSTYNIVQHKFKRLDRLKNDTLPKQWCDNYTDKMMYDGKKLHNRKKGRKPLLPGRGMGLADGANTTVIGDTCCPNDIFQGSIGDCWLLSAIACLADYDWAVKRLFRKTSHLYDRPFGGGGSVIKSNSVNDDDTTTIVCNKYIVTLWDLPTWKEVDIIIDERLPIQLKNSECLLGAKPSRDGKLWVPYLEKAIACHCGGYDKLVGGNCTNAWPMITGSRNQFMIQFNPTTNSYFCMAKYSPNAGWSAHSNSPHDSNESYWSVDWPSVGGGCADGDISKGISANELFYKIVAWDQTNYLIGAATVGNSDAITTDGIVDNHAYSVIDSREDICGTGIDLLLIRNPWGKGNGLKNGEFVLNGKGWLRYPEIKAELKPLSEDTGIFWLTKPEFFSYFPTLYVCAFNMAALKDENYVNDLEHDFPPPNKNAMVGSTHIIDPDEMQTIDIDTTSDPFSPYDIIVQSYNGSVSFGKAKSEIIKGKSIKEGVQRFKSNPEKYLAIHYQTNVVADGWPDHTHQYIIIYREGTEANKLKVKGIAEDGDGQRTFLKNVLKRVRK